VELDLDFLKQAYLIALVFLFYLGLLHQLANGAVYAFYFRLGCALG